MVTLAMSFHFVACGNRKEASVRQELDEIVGLQMLLSTDSVFRNGRNKVLVLLKDTGDCSPCSMGINEWYVYHLDMEENDLRGDIVYVMKENMHLPLSVDSLLDQYGLYGSYSYNEMMKRNPFLRECRYSTFLVSADGKIKLVGSPLDSPSLWNIYRKAMERCE